MPKLPSHRLKSVPGGAHFAAASLLLVACALLLATSSALGAHRLRDETARASGRHSERHPGAAHRRRPHQRSGGGSAIVRKADTTTSTALLGDEAIESNRDSLSGGQAEAFPFPAHASGIARGVHVYIDSANTATTLLVGLYSNASGRPGALLGSGSLSAPAPGAWDIAPVSSTPLVAGATYWLTVLGTGGTLHYRDRPRGFCRALTSAQTNLQALAATWSTGDVYRTCPVSGYVTAAVPGFPVEPPAPVELTPPPTESPPPPVETTPPPTEETTPPPVETIPPPVETTPPPTEETTPPPVETTPPPVEETTPPPVETPPPPPSPPTSSSPPTIAGTPTEGQRLTATTGAWTGSPTAYAYQWQDCNASGTGCSNVSAATGSAHTLGASDVGRTVRVVVSASNAGGSTPAPSAVTAVVAANPPPPPPPPTAGFSYSPASPVTGQAVSFNGTSSTCPEGPCTYEWSDDGGTTRPIPVLWPLGGGQTLSFTFSGVGTKYVRLVVTDAGGRSATVEHNVAVAEAPPPPPAAPSNTALPTVSGTPEVGQTLTTSNGTWSGSTPMTYTYHWQDCSATGASCSNISAATSSSYKPLASDVGHTLRAVVSAGNAGGTTSASSSATGAVTALKEEPKEQPKEEPKEEPKSEEPSLTKKECFENPETEGTSRIEACGYPGAHNVGVEKSALEKGLHAESGTVRLTGEEHYENKRLTGTIVVAWNAKNVVIKNDEIIDTGSCPSPQLSLNDGCVGNAIEFERRGSGSGMEIDEAAKGTRIAHVKVGGTEKHGPNTVQTCIDARWNSPYIAEYVSAEYCSGFKLNAGGELNHVYCPSNYEIGGEHYECVTDEGNELNATTLHTPLTIRNSTIFQPPIKTSVESSGLTAAIFQQSLYGSIQQTTLEKDLIAGGNFSVYFGEESGQVYKLTGPDTVRYNRFARCTSSKCPDSHGYFEEFGQYHVASFYNESKMTWTHNFIDNSLEECKLGAGLCY